MPVRDARHTLRQAIESILSQRGVRLELVIADDGSRDGPGTRPHFKNPPGSRLRLVICLVIRLPDESCQRGSQKPPAGQHGTRGVEVPAKLLEEQAEF